MEEQTKQSSVKALKPKYSDYMLDIAQNVDERYLESYLSTAKENRGWQGDSWGKDGWAGNWSGDSPWSGDSWNKSTS